MSYLTQWMDLIAISLSRAFLPGTMTLVLVLLLCQDRSLLKSAPSVGCWLLRLGVLKLSLGLMLPTVFELPIQHFFGRSPWNPPPPGLPIPPDTAFPFVPWVIPLWLIGVGWTAHYLWLEIQPWLRLRRECTPVEDPAVRLRYDGLCQRLGIRCPPLLTITVGHTQPMLLQVGRPVVIIPARLIECSSEELELILAHELQHFKRKDWLWDWLLTIVRVLFWFHPLFLVPPVQRWFDSTWERTKEIACDQATLAVTQSPPSTYARLLCGLASDINEQHYRWAVSVTSPFHLLRERLEALSKDDPGSWVGVVAARVILVCLFGLLIPCRITLHSNAPRPQRETHLAAQQRRDEEVNQDYALVARGGGTVEKIPIDMRGIGVPARAWPDERAPVVAYLSHRTPGLSLVGRWYRYGIQPSVSESGWVLVEWESNAGWIWSANFSGRIFTDCDRWTLRRTVRVAGRRLAAGEQVLVESASPTSTPRIVLPDGQHVVVPGDCLMDVRVYNLDANIYQPPHDPASRDLDSRG